MIFAQRFKVAIGIVALQMRIQLVAQRQGAFQRVGRHTGTGVVFDASMRQVPVPPA